MTGKLAAGSILGLGNPLLDFTCDVDKDFLNKWSLPENSAILAEPGKHDGLYEDMVKQYGSKVQFIAGGATQNSIRVVQWFVKQEKVCSYMGCVGDDADGRRMAEIATADGVSVLYMITKEEKTGTCAVCVTDSGKNRSLCAYLGAANKFSKDHVLKHWDAVQKANIIYSSGFHLTVSPDSMLEMAKHCAEHPEKTYVLNLAAPFIPEFFSDALHSVLPYTDILFGNETEAQSFAKQQKWPATLSNQEIAVHISKLKKANHKDRLVIITQGADDVIVVKRTASGHEEVHLFPVPHLAPEQIVDTNGAGDAFVGGYLSQLIQGKGLKTCIAAGNYASREVIMQSGAVFPKHNHFTE
jgi:adenosine kinase